MQHLKTSSHTLQSMIEKNQRDSRKTNESEDDRSITSSGAFSQHFKDKNNEFYGLTESSPCFEDILTHNTTKSQIRLHQIKNIDLQHNQKENLAPPEYKHQYPQHTTWKCQSQRVTLRDITAEVYRRQFKAQLLENVSSYLRQYISAPVSSPSKSVTPMRFKML